MDRNKRVAMMTNRYTLSILEGNLEQAERVVEEAQNQGYGIAEIYLKILAPAQNHVGKMWHEGNLNIAGEHLATQITIKQMEKLRRIFSSTNTLGLKIVVLSVEGEHHCLGAQMVADFFLTQGWDVDFLGSNVPVHDLVEFVRKRRPEMVALSVTLKKNFAFVLQTISALHSLPTCPKIIIGGKGIDSNKIPDEYKNKILLCDAAQVVKQANLLLGINKNDTLEHYLQKLGQRINKLRKNCKWTQEQLAKAAHIERTYISAVERGKQNITIGALLKIAGAFDTSLDDLLI